MIDKVAGILLEDKKLLVLRKKNPDNRQECILPGGKRELGETDEQTLKREMQEELGVEIEQIEYFNTYENIAIFEQVPIKLTAYVIKTKGEVIVQREIKEKLWISKDYKQEGIVCSDIIGKQLIPDLIQKGLM